jgi:2-dehydropantoate 2-reductase
LSTAWRTALPSKRKLSILAFGAGAIGGYIGGSLQMKGHRVVFLEREHNATRLRMEGLTLRLEDSVHQISNIEIATSIEETMSQEPFDIALFALKSYDTAAALKPLKPLANKLPPFLCLQNGVDNEAALAAVLGEENVIAGTVTTSIGKPKPGEIVLQRKRGIGISADHMLSEPLAAAMQVADLNPRLYSNAAEMKWSKLLTNLLANASCAILDMSPLEVLAHPALFEIEMRQLREAIAVMSANNLKVVDLPGTPIRALVFAARQLPLSLSRPLLVRFAGSGRGDKMPSLHIDLHSAKKGKSEISWLNGAVSRWGEAANIPTPANDLLHDTLVELISNPDNKKQYTKKPQSVIDALR